MGPILIVDDEFGIAEALTGFLEDEGYPSAFALNGRLAMEQMAKASPSLVFLDYMMPVMNGPAVLEAMKSDPNLRDVPVVLMSASPPKVWRDLPATDFLHKPFGLDQFLELVRRNLGHPPAR
ncbi:response regulator [Hyalangium rubrum]|uniref:Response regulator n=1 Tax=Hyalangium rubrum TaxID=3103134 RepID=A0ABU5HC22_9BACT|nr:response regulator [Hyalangium sp. s54d21]MDY7231003.1 response regulator [Hyalangium sp. s54d21]